MANKLKLFFSMLTGDMFYVEEDEVKNLDKHHIPLKQKPKGCKRCHDRFHEGYDIIHKYYLPCTKCMRKCADWDNIKGDEVTIERPKTTNEIADKAFTDAMNHIPFK